MGDAAAAALTEADAILAESTLRWCEAEVDRVAGEHFLRVGSFERAEKRFARALETARRQEARTFELRAATVLARLWIARGQLDRAHGILERVCVQFSEGLETPDLVEAKALLAL